MVAGGGWYLTVIIHGSVAENGPNPGNWEAARLVEICRICSRLLVVVVLVLVLVVLAVCV